LLLKYFDKVLKEAFIEINGEKIYLNHYPVNCEDKNFSLTGHVHSLWKVKKNMINVSCDAWHFFPICEEKIKFTINAIRNFYDKNVFL